MKQDGIDLTSQAIDKAPAGPGQRLVYIAPQVIFIGDLAKLTNAVGSRGRPDGGIQFGMKSSGL